MNIQIIKTEKISDYYANSTIEIDNEMVEIGFWLDLIDQWGKDDLKTFLFAEAMKKTNNLLDAHNLLKTGATGGIVLDQKGNKTDTRNWKQNWIDSYPVKTNELIDL